MIHCIPIHISMLEGFISGNKEFIIDLIIDNSDYIVPFKIQTDKIVELRIRDDYFFIYYDTER